MNTIDITKILLELVYRNDSIKLLHNVAEYAIIKVPPMKTANPCFFEANLLPDIIVLTNPFPLSKKIPPKKANIITVIPMAI